MKVFRGQDGLLYVEEDTIGAYRGSRDLPFGVSERIRNLIGSMEETHVLVGDIGRNYSLDGDFLISNGVVNSKYKTMDLQEILRKFEAEKSSPAT